MTFEALENLNKSIIKDNRNKYYLISEVNTFLEQIKEIPLENPQKILGRKWKSCLKRDLEIAEKLYFTEQKDAPVQLSQNMYNDYNPSFIYRALKDLEALKVIFLFKDEYLNSEDGYSKTYIIHSKNIKSFLDLYECEYIGRKNNKSMNIEIYNNKDNNINNNNIDNNNNNNIDDIYRDICLDSISAINEENKFFRYRVTGSRPYCDFCSSPKSERKSILNKYFNECEYIGRKNNNNEYNEWDRTSSIYNVTRFINKDIISNQDNDFYAELYGKNFKNKEERELFKTLCMSFYFSDKRKMIKLLNSVIDAELDLRKNKRTQKTLKASADLSRVVGFARFSGCEDSDERDIFIKKILDWYGKMRENLENIIGERKRKEIFLIEGAINLTTCKYLLEAGYKTVSVYDCFYTECKDNDFIFDCYKKASQYVKDYWWKKEK